jgi:ribosomal RNA-processing protein 9
VPVSTSKKRNTTSAAPEPAKTSRRKEREESISGSESSEEEGNDFFTKDDEDRSDSSDDENETAAEKRLRLAERYLENIRKEVDDDVGFDAAEIDRDLIAERLKEDVAETKGKIYRHITDQLDFEEASHIFAKSNQHAITGCAARLPYMWTVSKDLMLVKWKIADPKTYNSSDADRPTNISPRKQPKPLIWKKGNSKKAKGRGYIGHTGAILSIAVSDSGKFLATGDKTGRLILWDADTLTPRKLFTQHRDAVTSLSFRRGTEQLFSASADRTIKIWSAQEMAYIETLFGHQDSVVGIAGGLETNQETCVSVGSRDRTARLWKVVEESQLVFRGGGTARQKGMDKLRKGRFGAKVDDEPKEDETDGKKGAADDDDDPPIAYAEGSMDCVAILEAGLFVTGSDNGVLSLWDIKKKKPVFTLPLAHGRDPRLSAQEMSADVDAAAKGVQGPRLPRYITAMATVPFADLIITASWDGWLRAWRVGRDKRSIEEVGPIGKVDVDDLVVNGHNADATFGEEKGRKLVKGVVNGLSICERGDRGKDGLCIVAAVGKEHRLGRWIKGQGRNGVHLFEVQRKALARDADDSDEEPEA